MRKINTNWDGERETIGKKKKSCIGKSTERDGERCFDGELV